MNARLFRTLGWVAGSTALISALLAAAWHFSYASALESLRERGRLRQELYAKSIRGAIEVYETLPWLLATQDPEVAALLDAPENAVLRGRILKRMQALKERTGALDLYLMDRAGWTLVSTNPDFLNMNYGDRGYFADAMANGQGRESGVGRTSGIYGFFLAHAVGAPEARKGVVVAKVGLERLEREWDEARAQLTLGLDPDAAARADAGEAVLVMDALGVVFSSSRPEWRFRPLRAMSDARCAEIKKSYGQKVSCPLKPVAEGDVTSGQIAEFRSDSGRSSHLLVEEKYLPDLEWTQIYLMDPAAAQRQAQAACIQILLVTLGLGFAALWWRRDRYALRLERQNRALGELQLQDAQQDLLSAERIATIGAVAATLAHDIKYEIAGLQLRISRCLEHCQHGRYLEVGQILKEASEGFEHTQHRLQEIMEVVREVPERERQPIRLSDAVAAVLRDFRSKLGREGIELSCEVDPHALVGALPLQFELVVINLIQNAIDAMHGRDVRALAISTARVGNCWELSIADTGEGLRADPAGQRIRSFPTTRRGGSGLGLPASHLLLKNLGGELHARNNPSGGASFIIALPALDLPAAQGALDA